MFLLVIRGGLPCLGQSLEYVRTMRHDQPTDMGGVGKAFLTTHWSLLEDVGSTNEEKDRALVGLLLSRYWKPVYCFLHRKGYDNEQAKDLTQDFFHEIVLARSLFQRADPSKGRFRSFLLTALKRYLINVEHAKEAQKRIPALLERVLEEVKAQCHADGRAVYWHVFHDRILQPIKERADSPSVQETCTKYNIVDGIKLANMIVTVKRRIRSVLKRHVCDSVMSDTEAGEELETIMRFFPGLAQNQE